MSVFGSVKSQQKAALLSYQLYLRTHCGACISNVLEWSVHNVCCYAEDMQLKYVIIVT